MSATTASHITTIFFSTGWVKKLFLLPVLMVLIYFTETNLFAANVLFSWPQHSDSNVVGYKVYYGTSSGNYVQSSGQGYDLSGRTSNSITIPIDNFTSMVGNGATVYFAVTAYNNSGLESDYSSAASVYIPSPTADTDQDGVTDVNEILNGTDWQNPTDNLVMVDAGPSQAIPPGTVGLTGSITDPNQNVYTILWSQIDGPSTLDIQTAPSSLSASFMAVADGAYTLEFKATNQVGVSYTDTTVVTIENVPPTGNAGADFTVAAGSTSTLFGTGVDPNNDPLSFKWTQVAGTDVVFDNSAAKPEITFQLPGVYEFGLIVTDDNNADSTQDNAVVSVNNIPTADAGMNQTSNAGTTVTLDGSKSSDSDGVDDKPTGYLWSVVSIPNATDAYSLSMSATDTEQITFVPPVAGVYTFSLVVNDDFSQSTPSFIEVSVNDTSYFPPVADAGLDQTVHVGQQVTLAGGNSKTSGAEIFYTWVQTGGATVTLSDNTIVTPVFTPVIAGLYEFKLVVSDGINNSSPDYVLVAVSDNTNHVPTTDAGADIKNAKIGMEVMLDGSGSSDVDKNRLEYFWTQVSGSLVTLSDNNSVTPEFIPKLKGVYIFELQVFDGELYSVPDRVSVNVSSSSNRPPVANGGTRRHKTTSVGETVLLDGSASFDEDGDTLAYHWYQKSGPTVVLETNGATSSFVPTVEGEYSFELIVNDGELDSLPEEYTVSVTGQVVNQEVISASDGGSFVSPLEAFDIEVIVMPNSLDDDTEISVGISNIDLPLVENVTFLGGVISIEPASATLNEPLDVVVSPQNTDENSIIVVFGYNDYTRTWEELEVTQNDDGSIVTTLSDLSKLVVGQIQVEASNTDDSSSQSDSGSSGGKRGGGGCGFIKPSGSSGPGGSGMNFMFMITLITMVPFLRRLAKSLSQT